MSSTRRNEDSGLVDLDAILKQGAREELPPVAAPAPAPVHAAAPAPADAPTPVRASTPSTPEDSLSAVAAEASVLRVPPRVPVTRVTEVALPPRRGRRIVVVVAVAAAALAAIAVTRVARAPVASPPSVAVVPARATAPAVTPQTPAAEKSDNAVDPASLPTVAPEATAAAPKTVAPHVAVAAPAKPEAPAQIAEKELAPAAPADPSDLGAAMQSAVGSRAEARAEESKGGGDPNARQVRPSPGAVIGAMNAVLPAARACLGPDGAMRSGTLVFKSDGTVANVALKGAKSEDECVRGALAKARVQPFSDVSFTTGFTVRP